MSVSIPGKRISGHNLASGCVAKQLPLIVPTFPEIANCYPGTINVELVVPLLVLVPDHRTEALRWDDSLSAGEMFDFLRIGFEAPRGAPIARAWIYLSHWTMHRETPHIHEIIAPRLDMPDHCECVVHIDQKCGQLPYSRWPAVIVI